MKTFFENKGRRFLFCEVLFNQGHRSRAYDEIFYHFRKSRGPWASWTFANQGPHTVLHVGDQTIDPSVNGKNLGTIFDNSNSMDTHINQVLFYHIHNIRRISKYLSQESLNTFLLQTRLL